MMMEKQRVAIVEVGEDYANKRQTIEVEDCSMTQAQQLARDLGYQVIPEHCIIVQTTIVTVAPKKKGGEE